MQSLIILSFVCIFGVEAAIEEYGVFQFLQDIKREQNFQSVVLMKNNGTTLSREFIGVQGLNETLNEEQFLLANIMQNLPASILLLDQSVGHHLYRHYDNKLLAVVYMDGTLEQHTGLLAKLVLNLHLMANTRVLFLINLDESDEHFLGELFIYCWKHKLLNVAALFANYQISGIFFSYTHFPKFEIERKPIKVNALQHMNIYPDRLRNLNQYKVAIKIGGSEPRIIPYIKPNGEVIYLGAVGHLMAAFKQKFNCGFVEPLPTDARTRTPSQDLPAAVQNGTVDIAMAITFAQKTMRNMSYPFELLNWCTMMPVAADVPASELYTIAIEFSAFMLTLATLVMISLLLGIALRQHGYQVRFYDYALHDNCLRGILGQSFVELRNAPFVIRGIYLQICLLGIQLSIWYNSYFSAYVTSAPKQASLQTLDDVMHSNLKIMCWEPEYQQLIGRLVEIRKYTSVFLVVPDFLRFLAMRESFNTKYGYLIPSVRWHIIEEQQKIFTRRLFSWRPDMCFYNTVPMGFPMHENSIYRDMMNRLILELDDSGLSKYWREMAFQELIKTGKLKLVDLSKTKEFTAMEIEDLMYVVSGFLILICLSVLIFFAEIVWYQRKRIFNLKNNFLTYKTQ